MILEVRRNLGLRGIRMERLDLMECEYGYSRTWNGRKQLDLLRTRRDEWRLRIRIGQVREIRTSESLRLVLPSILRLREAGAGRLLPQLEGAFPSGVERCLRSMSNGDRPKGVCGAPREGGRLPV